jgi:hypothetical protein
MNTEARAPPPAPSPQLLMEGAHGLETNHRRNPREPSQVAGTSGRDLLSADSRQAEGLRSETKIRQFSLVMIDEPPSLGGADAGPNPVELVLAACQETPYRAHAPATGAPFESVSVKLDGSLDLRGFSAVSETARAGFSNPRRRNAT